MLLEHLAARMAPCDLEGLVARMAIVSDPASSDAGSGSARGSDAGGGGGGGGEGEGGT